MVWLHGGQIGRWCHVGSAAIRLWCDGLVAWRADTSAESSTVAAIRPLCDGPVTWRADGSLVSCGFRCYPPVVRRSGHTTSRYLAYLAGRSPSPAVARWPSPTGRQPLTVSATAPSAWPYVRWCRNWTAKHRLPLLPVRVCPVLPTPRVSDVRFLHYRR